MEPVNEQLKSERILDELKALKRTKEIIDVEEERVKVVIFKCGVKLYAFYGKDVREILPSSEISWVPSLPAYLPGLINVRGDIESVVDIRHFLGEEMADHGKHLIVMAVRGDFHAGVMIDSIEDVIDILLSTIHPPLATLSGAVRDLVAGEIEYGGDTVSLLDIGKLEPLITL
jgi:purine-binding chemotaxis protein CheW